MLELISKSSRTRKLKILSIMIFSKKSMILSTTPRNQLLLELMVLLWVVVVSCLSFVMLSSVQKMQSLDFLNLNLDSSPVLVVLKGIHECIQIG